MTKKQPWRLPIAEQGSVLLYFISFLSVFCLCALTISNRIQRYLSYLNELDCFERMNHAEVLVIYKIRQDFRLYRERDETLLIDGCLIIIEYQSSDATVEISCNGYVRQRNLSYDAASETITDYY